MSVTINARMKQRRKVAANWTSTNEVLLEGEIGLETDTRKFKFGNGTTAWNALSYGGATLGTGVETFLATPTSANLLAAVTDETGTGALVFATSPTLVTPVLGTPASGVLTNATGLPVGTGISGLATGVATFLGTSTSANLAAAVTDETGSGSLVFGTSPTLVTPALGTPASGVLTNATGLPISTGVSGLGTSVATFLATPSSANLAAALTDETGSGANVFATSPALTTPTIGGLATFDTGAFSDALIGVWGGTYNGLSLNGTLTVATITGFFSGGSGDNNLYANVPTGSVYNWRFGNTTLATLSATMLTIPGGIAMAGSVTGITSLTIAPASPAANLYLTTLPGSSAYNAIIMNSAATVPGMVGFFGSSTDTNLYSNVPTGGSRIWRINNASVGAWNATGLDIYGEARCDTLRIDATPTAAVVAQSHHVPVNINGTIYKLLLAS